MRVKVSVVVPVYNAEKYLETTVEKIINQTLKEIEIILVDDGSTDKSPKICDSFVEKDTRIKCIHIENSGVCTARNTGVSHAHGKYIGFCDADDFPNEKLYETLYELAENNNCQVSMVKYKTIFDDGKIINDSSTDEVKVYDNKSQVLSDFLKGKLYSGVYTKLFKKELCKKISFDEGRKINEDKMYIFDALRNADSWCFMDTCLYTYFRRYGSSSNEEFSEKYFDCIYFAEKMQKTVCEQYPEITDSAKGNTICAYLDVLKIMCLRSANKKYNDIFNSYVKYLRRYKISFCKNTLRKNDFIKWLGLKINKRIFIMLVKMFSRT